MQPQHKQLGRPAAQRGTSLIEILVVLVILVIGILSIVRLFPAGFIALRNAENNTFADRLAQGALEQLKQNGNGLPDAIYMYSTADGFIPSFAPTDFEKTYTPTNGSATSEPAAATFGDINKQRYISNETISVPAPHVISGVAYPPLYVVNYGPIYLPPATEQSEYGTFLPVNSTPWTAQTGDSRTNPSDASRSIDNPPDILQPGQQKYTVDYNAGAVAVPQAGYAQSFYIQVTINNKGPQNPVLVTVPATVPANASNPASGYNGNWFSSTETNSVVGASSIPASVPNSNPMLDNSWTSVALYRPFRCMGVYVAGTGNTPSTTFDSDPYEFALDGVNMGTASSTGVLAFNPLAAGQNGSQPLKARISYMTLDWHILHEDQNVAAGSPTVRLTLNHLKKIGDTQFDQTIFNGLLSDGTTPADIVILNLDTGAITTLAAPQNGAMTGNTYNLDDSTGPTPTSTNGIYQVSYQNGRITLPNSTTAQHLRFFYAGDADWALAIQKAPIAYNVLNANVNGNVTAPTAANYQSLVASGPAPNNCVIDTTAERVYFPVCDAGKTVEFDGISFTSTGGSMASMQIGEASAPISTDYAIPAMGGTALPYVNLSSTGLNSSGIITGSNGIAANSFRIQAVRGVSAQATVIWHERNNWRTRTIDTLLTQTP